MIKEIRMSIDDLFGDYSLSESEKELINFSRTDATKEISQAKIISDLYIIKNAEDFVCKLIDSNKKLAKSNNRYALALVLLTGALVVVGLIQIFFN